MSPGTRAGIAGAAGLLMGKLVANSKWYQTQLATAQAAAPAGTTVGAPLTARAVQYGLAFGAGWAVHRFTEGKGEAAK
jgi:hypothetical protein